MRGFAQVRGRNAISWDGKLNTDLAYMDHISFRTDLRMIVETGKKVVKREGVTMEGMETARWLREAYEGKQAEAKRILRNWEKSSVWIATLKIEKK